MAHPSPDVLRLARILGQRTGAAIRDVPEGSALEASLQDLLSALERFIPSLLRETFPEWWDESLDGFLLSKAEKVAVHRASLSGLAIVISDQSVTPFRADLTTSHDSLLLRAEISVGEAGGGSLGISGPGCNTKAASTMLAGIPNRLESVDWTYQARYATERRVGHAQQVLELTPHQ